VQKQAFPTDAAFLKKPHFLQLLSIEQTWCVEHTADSLLSGCDNSSPVSKPEQNQHGATALI
jgi:hypothetical protein